MNELTNLSLDGASVIADSEFVHTGMLLLNADKRKFSFLRNLCSIVSSDHAALVVPGYRWRGDSGHFWCYANLLSFESNHIFWLLHNYWLGNWKGFDRKQYCSYMWWACNRYCILQQWRLITTRKNGIINRYCVLWQQLTGWVPGRHLTTTRVNKEATVAATTSLEGDHTVKSQSPHRHSCGR